jgi:hypothetical protein
LTGLNTTFTCTSDLQDKTSLQQTKARLVDAEKKLKNMEWDQEILEQKFGQVRQTQAAVLAIFDHRILHEETVFRSPSSSTIKKETEEVTGAHNSALNWALRAARSESTEKKICVNPWYSPHSSGPAVAFPSQVEIGRHQSSCYLLRAVL